MIAIIWACAGWRQTGAHQNVQDRNMIHANSRWPRTRFAALAFSVSALAAAVSASEARFSFAAFGNFKRMSHTGDSSGQVKLADLPQGAGTWGVGALADLKGEVLLHDGRLLVSRGEAGDGHAGAPHPGDEAALFAVARVRQWAEVTVPMDMTQGQFEAFVLKQASSMGLDGSEPFPFRVQGRYPKLLWHVITGRAKPGAHRGEHGSAGKKTFEQAGVTGQLVGVYSGVRFEGVVSHPGERFHIHFVDLQANVSGHADAYAVAAGASLLLPLR
jgi:alpha-acetolactate decarboxylase